ncbi:hypothetical protein [Helicobacter rodentium]|uniref:hypothetical protein n=1 Tax=Helicobacter rodentium TaxID=59617 RepID=UPI00255801EB|nr:hypothetical protein [Helicobacter rodentium]
MWNLICKDSIVKFFFMLDYGLLRHSLCSFLAMTRLQLDCFKDFVCRIHLCALKEHTRYLRNPKHKAYKNH